MKLSKILLFIVITGISTSSFAHGKKEDKSNQMMVNTDTEVGEVVAELHTALRSSDEATIRSILADNVLIFEGSGAERSLEEYASHHMKSDMKFLKHMATELLERNIMIHGDVAISSSRSKMTGKYKNKDFNKVTVETLVLKKNSDGWKVIRVHWS